MLLSVNPLSYLRNQPQFQVMRQLIQQNAALLPALLQEIGRENPELLQVKTIKRLVRLWDIHVLLYTENGRATTVMCHCRRFEATKRSSSRC